MSTDGTELVEDLYPPERLPRRVRFGALLNALPKPFSAPSLPSLDARVAALLTRADEVRGLRATTLRWARQSYASLRAFLVAENAERAFLSGDVQSQVAVLQRWVGWLRSRGAHTVAVNSTWRGAASVFRWLADEDGILSPFAVVEPPRFAQRTPAFLPRQEAERLLVAMSNFQWTSQLARYRNLALVGLMLLAGLRRGEVLRLTIADVDLDNARIRVLGAKGMHGGKDRVSWMPPLLVAILRDYLAVRRRAARTHPELLTHLRKNHGVDIGSVQHLFRDLSRLLGSRVTPHMLRHTYATLLRQSGVADRVSMELLGHTSLAMLQRYSHVENDEARRAADQLRLNVVL